MATITTISASDNITDSRTVINTNFDNLNTDKIETSYLDTDTSLSADSDTKIATQKAVKTYIDTSGGANASETARGIVEEATDAEVTAGTATGGTGAKLFVTPAKLATQAFATSSNMTTRALYTIGALDNSLVKTYFNIQLPFILWVGDTDGALTTPFDNWVRDDATKVFISPMGIMANFASTGTSSLTIGSAGTLETSFIRKNATTALDWSHTNILILDWWAILSATNTGDVNMGFGTAVNTFVGVYNDTAGNGSKVAFCQKSTGELYATIAEEGVGVTNTDISSGLTLTNWNNYRIELDLGNEAKFYVNGVLKATLSGANLEVDGLDIFLGFGRSDTAIFAVTAPTLSIQMNP